MKKLIALLSLLLLFVACGENSSEKEKNQLYIYSWADFIPRQIYEKFEKETGIKIIEDIYSSNEEMYAKLKAGASGYDILLPSTDYVEILNKEGMIEKLDKSKISTFKNIDPEVLKKVQYFDPDNSLSIPYAMGATGIIVNKKYINNYPRDFSIYLREDFKGKMTLLDDMREVMTSALLTLNYKADTTNEEEIKEAAELIKKWKKNIVKFDSESFGKGFATEEFYVVHGYSDNVYRELDEEQRKNTEFIIPEKGGTSYIDSFVITKNSKNMDNAYKFLEFIHRPDVYAEIADILEIPSINIPAKEIMKTQPLYEISDLKNTEILRDIKDSLQLQNKYWQNILIAQ
ncbi:MAG: extracellular solute-binding protein [Fusobacteriaceae bacterium]